MFVLLILLVFFTVLVVFGCAPSADEPPELLKDQAQIAEQIRYLKQCYLLSRAEELIEWRHSPDGKAASTDPVFPRYRNIATVTDVPHRAMSAMTVRPEGQKFLELENDEVAKLSPMIRLWKRIPRGKEKYDEYEFPFKGAYSPKRNRNPLEPSNYGSEAGIQDFSFKLAGTNPAEADKFINVSIKFYFASMGDLFREWSTVFLNGRPLRSAKKDDNSIKSQKSHPLRFVDLINYNQKDQQGRGGYQSSSDAKTGEKNPYYYDGSFQILAEVGWHDKQAWTALMLQLTGHELSFNTDGSLTLTADYIGRIEGALAGYEMNIFWVPKDAELKDKLKELARLRKRGSGSSKKIEMLEAALKDIEDGQLNTITPVTAKIREASEKKALETAIQQTRGSSAYLQKVLGLSAGFSDAEAEQAIYASDRWKAGKWREMRLDLLQTALERALEGEKTRAGQNGTAAEKLSKEVYSSQAASRLARYARIMEYLDENGRVFTLNDDASALGIFSLQQIDASIRVAIEQRTPSRGLSLSSSGRARSARDKIADAATKTKRDGKNSKVKLVSSDTEKIKQNEIKMPFIFLGDLFDALVGILKEEYEGDHNTKARATLEEVTLLMGPVVLETADKKTKKIKRTVVNMGDLPVSLDIFFAWFQREIIAKDVDAYNLLAFMKEIMSTIIFSAMGEGCFGNQKHLVRPGMLSTLIKKTEEGPRVGKNAVNVKVGTLKAGRAGRRQAGESYEQILYLFSREQEMGYLDGEYKSNEANGIYHLYVGSGKGLVKKIAFARTDFAYLRESRITNQADETANDGFLREKYDATITMLGNALFQPGQHLYIDPKLPGSPGIGAAKKLGFTGYYFVHQINHVLGAGIYQTEIKAIHQGPASDGNVKEPVVKEIYKVSSESKNIESNVASKKKPLPASTPKKGDLKNPGTGLHGSKGGPFS
jgi:hypothetical protein